MDVKPNIEELLENINHIADDNLNELEIKSEESKAFYNDNVDCGNDDFDSDAFNSNRYIVFIFIKKLLIFEKTVKH